MPSWPPQSRLKSGIIDGWEVRIEKECLRSPDTLRASGIGSSADGVGTQAQGGPRASERLGYEDRQEVEEIPPGFGRTSIPASLDILARMATDAFSEVVAALGKVDAVAARAAIAGDQEIDRQCRVVLRELKDSLQHHPEWVTPLLRLVNSARNLERIVDHTVNIAEAIVYIKG